MSEKEIEEHGNAALDALSEASGIPRHMLRGGVPAEDVDTLGLRQVHRVLQRAYEDVCGLYGDITRDIGSDTAFAIGEATGILAKAKALVGRDIDDAARRGGES